MARRAKELPLLVVDGYNVLHAREDYLALLDHGPDTRADRFYHDPFARAREKLIGDVAAYAQGSYEAVIVFDGGGNLNPERPALRRAGVRIVFSATGTTADFTIEALVAEAKEKGRSVAVVSSDSTIQATVSGHGVTRISAQLLVHDVEALQGDVVREREERVHSKMTMEDRIDPDVRAKLDRLRGKLSRP